MKQPILTIFGPDAARGAEISFDDGVWTNRCVVTLSDGGALSCWSGRTRGAAPFDAEAQVALAPELSGDASWAYAMLEGAPLAALMDKLGLPLSDRVGTASILADQVAEVSARLRPDGRALGAMAKAPSRRPGSLAFYVGDGERAERRRQAAASYPLLADLLASGLATKMAIDRGRPLADAAAQALSGLAGRPVSKAVLKRVAAADRLPAGCSIETVSRFMTCVPPDWIHAEGEEWEAFCRIAHALLDDLGAPDGAVPALVSGCSGRWREFAARICRKSGVEADDPGEGARRVMFTAAEMIRCFAEVAILPMAAHAGDAGEVSVTPEMVRVAARVAFDALAAGRNAADLGEIQRRWHQERHEVLAVTGAAERAKEGIEEGGWPGLTHPVMAPNGVWLVPLTNPEQLGWEGSPHRDPNGSVGLSHCVGGYDRRAKSCECFIISLRTVSPDGSYTRLSTAELGPLPMDESRIKVRQNRARENGDPPPEAHDALSWYLGSIAAGEVKVNREQIAAFLDQIYVPDDGVERLCGYDWRDRDVLNSAVSPWAPFVSRTWRGQGLDALMDSPGVASITKMIPPDILLSPAR